MLSRFGKPDGNTQHHTPTSFRLNTNGNKYSTITYDFIPSHFGIRDSVAPTNLIHHLGDFAGRNSLQIHFCYGEVESPVNSRSSFKSRDDGGEGSLRIPDLWDIQSHLPGGRPNGTRFESIPLAIPCWYTFITFTF